jgi:hypothetical protein
LTIRIINQIKTVNERKAFLPHEITLRFENNLTPGKIRPPSREAQTTGGV